MLNLYVKLAMLQTLAADRLYAMRLEQDDRGATAVEYGVMVALIIAVVIGVVATIGQRLLAAFTLVRDQLPGGGT